MLKKISPLGVPLRSRITVPGDKSISHRALILASIAEGTTLIDGLLEAADVARTEACLRALGIKIERDAYKTRVEGQGLSGLRAPVNPLDAGNSGTTARLLTGILAAQPFTSLIHGDASLQRRPMRRIIEPLTKMGARITCTAEGTVPLEIRGASLQGITYELPVASAQVKSAILLAGLFAHGQTIVLERKSVTRDHTERMLQQFGASIRVRRGKIALHPGPLRATQLNIPGDFSSAIFWLAATCMIPGSEVTVFNVGLNATRSYALKILHQAGADIELANLRLQSGEEVADVTVRASKLNAFHIAGWEIPLLIDEIPILAILASQSKGTSSIRDAGELRVKECDRITAIVSNLRKMGGKVREFEDGFEIDGPTELLGAEVDSYRDHRVAMAFAIAGLVANKETLIRNAEVVDVSYPGFFQQLHHIVKQKSPESLGFR